MAHPAAHGLRRKIDHLPEAWPPDGATRTGLAWKSLGEQATAQNDEV
jgi:hypothetical protein